MSPKPPDEAVDPGEVRRPGVTAIAEHLAERNPGWSPDQVLAEAKQCWARNRNRRHTGAK